MVVPNRALKPQCKSATVSTRWLAQVAVSARPKRNGVMVRMRRQNFASVPQALSNDSENTHWNLSRSEEHTSELQSQSNLVCRLLLEKKKKKNTIRQELLSQDRH